MTKIKRTKNKIKRSNKDKTSEVKRIKKRNTNRRKTYKLDGQKKKRLKNPSKFLKSDPRYESLKMLPPSQAKTNTHKDKNVSAFKGYLITDVPIAEREEHKGSNASMKHFYRTYCTSANFKRFFYKILKKMGKKLLYIAKQDIFNQWKDTI